MPAENQGSPTDTEDEEYHSLSPLSSPNSRQSYQKKYRDNLTAMEIGRVFS
jgi:hypothetical protein